MGAGNGGGNMGGQDMGGQGPNGMHQQHATEYTLQGERLGDRAARMKGRIAALEGSARRADATQKALKRYVGILEKKVKEQSAQLKTGGSAATEGEHAVRQSPNVDRAALIAEKLNPSDEKPKDTIPGFEGMIGERAQEDEERDHLRAFLDQCQAETPEIPTEYEPPCASYAAGTQSCLPWEKRPRFTIRAHGAVWENSSTLYSNPNEWPAPVGVAVTSREAAMPKQNHVSEHPRQGPVEETVEKRSSNDSDGWDFSEGSFPEATSSQPLQNLSSTHRPDQDVFPAAENLPKSPNRGPTSHRRKTSLSRRKSSEHELSLTSMSQKPESGNFKLRYGLRGHLNTVRTVIFSGGGSPGEPEICTAGDDGLVKRFHIPRESSAHMNAAASDLDVTADFTHRGHAGAVLCLLLGPHHQTFQPVGALKVMVGFSQEDKMRLFEYGHTDAVWAICVLPATLGGVFGQTNAHGAPDRILLVSGAADSVVKVWAVSAPPQLTSPQPAPTGRRAGGSGRVRGNSMSSGSQFPSSPQPSMTSNTPFNSTLIHNISRSNGSKASPTCITPLSGNGEAFVVSYSDAAIIIYDTRTGEEIGNMASLETYDGTIATSVNSIVATTAGLDQNSSNGLGDEDGNATGARVLLVVPVDRAAA
ncbi:hypothetical protein PG994_001477 [Apiospora phragmitis]|uniref:Striatin N-terminal domain-containing protein n=1 Tax=Apiospora phragmitis TaxID=2905665 RepID=A0ABR1WTR1_9PEZI